MHVFTNNLDEYRAAWLRHVEELRPLAFTAGIDTEEWNATRQRLTDWVDKAAAAITPRAAEATPAAAHPAE